MKHLTLRTPTFLYLEESFKEWLSILGYSGSTVYRLPVLIREFMHHLENKGIQQTEGIDEEQVKLFMDYSRQRKKLRTGGGLSNSHLNKQLQAIKTFGRYLRETGRHSFPLDLLQYKTPRSIKAILTPEEIKLLYRAAAPTPYGLRDKVMLGVYYGCGLRRNEGLQLDVNDVLLERGMLYVRKGKNFTERYVPLNPEVIKDMAWYLHQVRPQLLHTDKPDTAFFISQRGGRIDGLSMCLRLKKLQTDSSDNELQQKEIGLHTLRHSIATHLLQGGMRLERIAQFLGHKSIESTQIYTHLAHEPLIG